MSCDPASRAGAVLDIDLGAVAANWRLLAERAAPASCAAVVKANGYGLGAGPVARRWRPPAAGCFLSRRSTRGSRCARRSGTGPRSPFARNRRVERAVSRHCFRVRRARPDPGPQSSRPDRGMGLNPALSTPSPASGGGFRTGVRLSARHPPRRYRDGAARSHAARVFRLCRELAGDPLARGDQPSGLRRGPRAPAQPAATGPLRRCRFAFFSRAGKPCGLLRHLSRSALSFQSGASGGGAVLNPLPGRPIRCVRW